MKKPNTTEVRAIAREIIGRSVQTWTNKLVTKGTDVGNRSVCFACGDDARSVSRRIGSALKRKGFESEITVTPGSGYRTVGGTVGGYVRVVCTLA